MIRPSACQPWPPDQRGPTGHRGDAVLSYTTLRDTIAPTDSYFVEELERRLAAAEAS